MKSKFNRIKARIMLRQRQNYVAFSTSECHRPTNTIHGRSHNSNARSFEIFMIMSVVCCNHSETNTLFSLAEEPFVFRVLVAFFCSFYFFFPSFCFTCWDTQFFCSYLFVSVKSLCEHSSKPIQTFDRCFSFGTNAILCGDTKLVCILKIYSFSIRTLQSLSLFNELTFPL